MHLRRFPKFPKFFLLIFAILALKHSFCFWLLVNHLRAKRGKNIEKSSLPSFWKPTQKWHCRAFSFIGSIRRYLLIWNKTRYVNFLQSHPASRTWQIYIWFKSLFVQHVSTLNWVFLRYKSFQNIQQRFCDL